MNRVLITIFILANVSLALQNQQHLDIPYQTSQLQQLFRKQKIIPNQYMNDNWCPPTQSKTYCIGASPCCEHKGRYGCCPYSYGKCCGDGYCVPSGGSC